MKRFMKGAMGGSAPAPAPPPPKPPMPAPDAPEGAYVPPPPPPPVPAAPDATPIAGPVPEPSENPAAPGPDKSWDPQIDAEAPPSDKPARGRRLKGLFQGAKPRLLALPALPVRRRGAVHELPATPPPDVKGNVKADVKAERRSAQLSAHAKAVEEWEQDLKYKRQEAEAHGVEFDDATFRKRPATPPPAPGSASESGSDVAGPQSGDDAPATPPPPPGHPSAFRPIAQPPVAPERQPASAVAELFAAQAYGASPAAVPGATGPRTPLFAAAGRPMIPPSARAPAPAAAPPPRAAPLAAPPARGPALYQRSPPPPVAPGAGGGAGYGGAAGAGAGGFGAPGAAAAGYGARGPVQSQTYIDGGLAEKIRRGRELERLGIAAEEGGNLGHAQAAYLRSLELLIPAIAGLDHGPDVSYAFRAAEKRKLQNEAKLMLDRCEELKRFLALNAAAVPSARPKLVSQMRRERQQRENAPAPAPAPAPATAARPVAPLPPPPPGLLDGFSALGFGSDTGAPDPTAQQGYPRAPAPMPPALPPAALHGAAAPRVSGAQRTEMLSRPPAPPAPPAAAPAAAALKPSPPPPPALAPSAVRRAPQPPLPPQLPETPPALRDDPAPGQFEDAAAQKCDVCRKEDATLAGPCKHVFCASHGNRSAALGWCLQPDCSQRLTAGDMKHVLH